MFSRSTFQTTAIYDEVLRQVCGTFGIETLQEEQQKATGIMFFESNDPDVSVSLSTGYGKSIFYQAAPVIDRLFSLEKKAVTLYIVPPVKALTEDLVHYRIVVGPRGLSAFNFRSLCERCCEAKLKLVVPCSDSLDWEKSCSFFTLAA